MRTYTAIALLSLLSITLSPAASGAVEPAAQSLETATAEYMLSVQTQQRGERTRRKPRERKNFVESSVSTDRYQEF